MNTSVKRPIAIALEYDHIGAPTVVAKGQGDVGQKIIDVAKANNIPIEENAPLAGALSKVQLGDEIPQELYRAVAEVLTYVIKMSRGLR